MSQQSSLFDLDASPAAEGERRKAEGVHRALVNADQSYRERFEAEVIRQSATGRAFYSSDIIAIVGMPKEGSPNIVGSIFNALANRRLIRRTGNWRKSDRAEARARIIWEWVGIGRGAK